MFIYINVFMRIRPQYLPNQQLFIRLLITTLLEMFQKLHQFYEFWDCTLPFLQVMDVLRLELDILGPIT